MMAPTKEVLPDLLKSDLDLVICGTAAGKCSASVGVYYAKPGNRFWKILHCSGLTSSVLKPRQFRKLLEFGIGLTDLAKYSSGLDDELTEADLDVDKFRIKIEKMQPRILVFNGKKAASTYFRTKTGKICYGPQEQKIGSTTLFVATQTSGSNGHWKPEPWYELADLVREKRSS